MALPRNKTKIVCTIGPASEAPSVLKQMIRAGMNVARLNLSHGDLSAHGKRIERVRAAAQALGRRVAIMVDLPGPKIRVGRLAKEPVELRQDECFVLTTEEIVGDLDRASVSFPRLPQVVKPGDALFLNDGLVQLEVEEARGREVRCRVVVGGELSSRKGLNLPGIDLGISAFTDHDRDCLEFALRQGVDAVSQSFVESGADVRAVREATVQTRQCPYIIAKIERAGALDHIDEILEVADGIMIARGDLGVEIPIERISVVQKRLVRRANLLGKPVITATQMLESMAWNRRPTRAEATDVANAILDGTDCVMLSEESAIGKYPVDAVAMLVKIAAVVEPYRPGREAREELRRSRGEDGADLADLISWSVEATLEHISPAAVIVPTRSGHTAKSIARFRLPVWITAVSPSERSCQRLQFSYGVYPVHEPNHPEDWRAWARGWLESERVEGNLVVLTEGPSPEHPQANHRMEIVDLDRASI